ncbi:MAG: Uma2 family endonuclease, partial [Synechocystis sp.]
MLVLETWAKQLDTTELERHELINAVSWQQYEALLAESGDHPGYRLHYLDQILEIMSPSRWHESQKTRLGNLLEIYFLRYQIPYFPTGSTTFKNELKQVGLEPDESYCLVTDKAIPDLAIEVILTSGGLNRLALYQRLGVPEVWFYQKSGLTVYHQAPEMEPIAPSFGYQPQSQSVLLPSLDLTLLQQALHQASPLAAAQYFQQGL